MKSTDNIHPLRDMLLVKLETAASKSGLVLSDSAKESLEHTLIALRCGPDVSSVKEGDILLVNTLDFMGVKLKVTEDTYIIPETTVVAVERL